MRKLMIIILAAILASSCEMEKEHVKDVFVSVAIEYGAPSGECAVESSRGPESALSADRDADSSLRGYLRGVPIPREERQKEPEWRRSEMELR